MIVRAKAPLRIGLAGGGTDVSPYSDLYGGAILNTTLGMYALASIEPLSNGKIELYAADKGELLEMKASDHLPIDGQLDLLKGVYNRVIKEFALEPLSFRLTTYVDSPFGSGLGTSSTVTVAILGAFAEWLNLPLGEYDIAHLAYQIEREDLAMAGGKQDQFAATFGGFNFMEFFEENKVVVNPLRIKSSVVNELQFNLLLYHTGTSRLSSKIIEKQVVNFQAKEDTALEAAHRLKEQAFMMKKALIQGKLDEIGEILDYGWNFKKQTAKGITNPLIDEIYEAAKNSGATGGKISGAGGGGYMILYAPANARFKVMKTLQMFGGSLRSFNFENKGLTTWRY